MISKGLTQAYEMQDFAHEVSMAIREQLKQDGQVSVPDKETAQMIGTLGKVWKDAQEQIRIHRGKPLPGSLTHEKVSRQDRKRSTITLYAGPSPVESAPAEPTSSEPASPAPDAQGEQPS